MKKSSSVLLAFVFCFVFSAYAKAGQILIDTTIDLSLADYFHNPARPIGVAKIYPLKESVLIGAGDTVDMTVHFSPGQALSIRSSGGRQFFTGWLGEDFILSEPGTSYFTISNATLTFFDQVGNEVLALARNEPQASGSAHIGPLFFGEYLPSDSTLIFSSYRTTFAVNQIQGVQYYTGPFLQFADLDGGLVTLVSTVPEPATAFLLFAGLAMIFLFSRRKNGNRGQFFRSLE